MWLPDKSEDSYKIFFLLVQKEMEKLGLEMDIASVLTDFELNIMKSPSMDVFSILSNVSSAELTGMA